MRRPLAVAVQDRCKRGKHRSVIRGNQAPERLARAQRFLPDARQRQATPRDQVEWCGAWIRRQHRGPHVPAFQVHQRNHMSPIALDGTQSHVVGDEFRVAIAHVRVGGHPSCPSPRSWPPAGRARAQAHAVCVPCRSLRSNSSNPGSSTPRCTSACTEASTAGQPTSTTTLSRIFTSTLSAEWPAR